MGNEQVSVGFAEVLGRRRRLDQSSDKSIHVLAVTWILMVPLAYFAVSGVVRFDTSSKNNMLSSGILNSSADIRSKVTLLVVALICLLLFSPNLVKIISKLWGNSAFAALLVWAFTSAIWSQFPALPSAPLCTCR